MSASRGEQQMWGSINSIARDMNRIANCLEANEKRARSYEAERSEEEQGPIEAEIRRRLKEGEDEPSVIFHASGPITDEEAEYFEEEKDTSVSDSIVTAATLDEENAKRVRRGRD